MKKLYTVRAKVTTYCTLEVEAENGEEALEIANNTDGGDFVTDNVSGDFQILEVQLANGEQEEEEAYILNEIDWGASKEVILNLATIKDNGDRYYFLENLLRGIRQAREIPEYDRDFIKLDEDFDFDILSKLGYNETFTTTDSDGDQRTWFLTSATSINKPNEEGAKK